MAVISLQTAATGLSALNTEMDVIANNLANVNTDGFKASRVNFQDLLYQEKKLPGVENSNGDQRPMGLYIGLGVQVSGTQLDFQQGSPQPTGRNLDVAIDGIGFFRVSVEPDRGVDGVAFTRAGNFTLNSDGEIVLATDTGRRLEPVITIPEEALEVDIGADGKVYYSLPGAADPVEAGQIELSAFINAQGLKQIGENLFTETAASGPPVPGNPGEQNLGILRSGFVEASNVDPTLELVKLIKTQRAFEMNSNVIRAADETLRAIANLRS